jgi:hypothetical protein
MLAALSMDGGLQMTNPQQSVKELQQTYQAQLEKRTPFTPHVLVQRDIYLRPAFLGDWKTLSAQASKQHEPSSLGLTELRTMQSELNALRDKVAHLLSEATSVWSPLHARAEWSDIRQKLMNALKTKTSPTKAAVMVKKLGAVDASDLSKRILKPIEDRSKSLDEVSISWHARLLGAELAHTVAAFNLHPRGELDESGATLDTWLGNVGSELEEHRKAIWLALRARDLSQLRTGSASMLQWVTGDTLHRATSNAAALARARHGSVNAWKLGPQALGTAELIRALLLGEALARRTEWLAGSDLGSTKDWFTAARNLPFASRWRQPRSTKLSVVWARAKQLAGKTITVEGVIGRVSNIHVRRKVFSSAWISDAQGTSLRVGITHIKMDSGGFVEGSYGRVTGTFSTMDQDFGTPIVRIDQRKYSEDAEHSWSDWTALELRRIFTPIPHGLTLSWSWEPGAYGAGNQLRYGTWLPFERGN